MTIKQTGGIFGRNPSFNEVEANQVGIGLDDPKGALHVKLGTGYSAGNTWNTGSAVFGGEAATDGALGLTYNNTDGSILASIIPLTAWKPVKVHASQFSVFVNGSSNVATVDGDGLKFNGDTAAANALSDYEEGTWTPTQGNFATWTSPTFNATYIKIGRIVTVSLTQTGGTISGNALQYIGGLPFSPKLGLRGTSTSSNGSVLNVSDLLAWDDGTIYVISTTGSQTSWCFSLTYEVA